jgi:hypothetical protein
LTLLCFGARLPEQVSRKQDLNQKGRSLIFVDNTANFAFESYI